MTLPLACKSWLPATALERPVADRLLSEALRGWSTEWFSRRAIRPLAALAQARHFSASSDDADRFTLDEAIGLGVPRATRRILALAMLDKADSCDAVTAGDRRILDDLAQAALDDLLIRLGHAFFIPRGAKWIAIADGDQSEISDRWECALAIGVGPELMRFAISNDAVIGAITGTLPRPKNGGALEPINTGLARQTVEVGALLGRSAVTLAEVASLTRGDVIVLDRPIGSELSLAFDGRPRGQADCTIEQQDGVLGIRLLHRLDR